MISDFDKIVESVEAQIPIMRTQLSAVREQLISISVPSAVRRMLVTSTRALLKPMVDAYSSVLHELVAFDNELAEMANRLSD